MLRFLLWAMASVDGLCRLEVGEVRAEEGVDGDCLDELASWSWRSRSWRLTRFCCSSM